MLNKIITLFVLLSVPFQANAEEGKFTYLEPGMESPFKGTLFDDSATAHLLTLEDYFKDQCKLKLNYELGLQNEKFEFEKADLFAKIEFLEADLESTKKQANARIALLERELKKNTRNDKHWFVIGGFAAGVGLTIGIIEAVK